MEVLRREKTRVHIFILDGAHIVVRLIQSDLRSLSRRPKSFENIPDDKTMRMSFDELPASGRERLRKVSGIDFLIARLFAKIRDRIDLPPSVSAYGRISGFGFSSSISLELF
ncbi:MULTISPECIES: hypothetical protein [unclassified Rhizobium]|uniref:hypothetical protein n=1 Tax=Rhizobium sp. PP-CC-3G-465 TaxID=2135648 RepID=UPI000DA1F941